MSSRARSRYQTRLGHYVHKGTSVPYFGDLSAFEQANAASTSTYDLGTSGLFRFDRLLDEYISDVVGLPDGYNSCSHTKSEAASFGGVMSWNYGSWNPPNLTVGMRGNVIYSQLPTLPTPNYGALVDQLAQQVQGRSGDSVMMLLILKEIAQTSQMIRNPFSLLKRDWRKTVKRFSAAKLAKEGANVWLEQLYGWQSFFRDSSDLAKVAGKTMIDLQRKHKLLSGLVTRYRAVDKTTGRSANVYGLNTFNETMWKSLLEPSSLYARYNGLQLSNISWEQLVSLTCHVSSLYNAAYTITGRLLAACDANTWHGIRDFLWEAVPFSFVVDWFVDTRGLWSTTNKALISAAGADHIGFSKKVTVEYDASLAFGTFPPAYYGSLYGWYQQIPTSSYSRVLSPTSRGKTVSFTRTSGWPPVDCPFYFGGQGLNISQWGTSAALILQKTVK